MIDYVFLSRGQSSNMGKGQEKGPSSGFSEAMLETYRECFRLMDIDRDGVINKNDLRAAFDNVGKSAKIVAIIQATLT